MTQKEILRLAIEIGVKNDLRGEESVRKYLARQKEIFDKLSQDGKKEFDRERLENPFMDSGVWVDNGQSMKKVLASVDVTSGDVMTAKALGFDGIINHHPLGKGLAMLDQAMHLQAEVLANYGVPINVAESLMRPRISEVARGVHAANHYKIVDAARLMNVNLMNIHTPADNCVASFLKKEVEKKNPQYVGEILDILRGIEEYRISGERGVPVRLFSGSEENRAGRIVFTELTGGTEGAKNMYQELARAGAGTVVAMHLSEESRKNAEEAHLNVVIASHIASDSVGLNLILDELEKKGVEVVPGGGLIRVKRK